MRRLLIFLPIVILLEIFIWSIPREIAYHDSNLVRGIAMFGSVFLFIPGCMVLAFSKLKSKNWMIIPMASIMINGFGFATKAQVIEVQDLKERGEWTKSIVIDTKSVHRKQVSYNRAVICRYKVSGRKFETKWEGDYTETYRVGDTVELVYLPDFPKVYRIIDGRNTKEKLYSN
jgi:hypothetical protein